MGCSAVANRAVLDCDYASHDLSSISVARRAVDWSRSAEDAAGICYWHGFRPGAPCVVGVPAYHRMGNRVAGTWCLRCDPSRGVRVVRAALSPTTAALVYFVLAGESVTESASGGTP